MALLDFLVGRRGLENRRDTAIDYARETYDPSVLSPQMDVFRRMASEGVRDTQESMSRSRAMTQLFRDEDYSLYGGNQASAIAGSQARSGRASDAYAEFEGQLTQADIEAMQRGEMGVGQTRSQQRQIMSQRDAAEQEAELQFQTELQRRRGQLGTAALGVIGTLATTPFGDEESLIERGLGSVFGGEEGTPTPPEVTRPGMEGPEDELFWDLPQMSDALIGDIDTGGLDRVPETEPLPMPPGQPNEFLTGPEQPGMEFLLRPEERETQDELAPFVDISRFNQVIPRQELDEEDYGLGSSFYDVGREINRPLRQFGRSVNRGVWEFLTTPVQQQY